MLRGGVFPGDLVSRSRPPRQGRSLRSRRQRSAAPNLDPASTRTGFGACGKDEQVRDGRTGNCWDRGRGCTASQPAVGPVTLSSLPGTAPPGLGCCNGGP